MGEGIPNYDGAHGVCCELFRWGCDDGKSFGRQAKPFPEALIKLHPVEIPTPALAEATAA